MFFVLFCAQTDRPWNHEMDRVLERAYEVAQELAANPIPSLVATKSLMQEAGRSREAWEAHGRENGAYAELMGAPEVDGVLVGGASLKADSFADVVRATA